MRITGNFIIDCALVAWFLAQAIKVLLDLLVSRTFDPRRFVSSGGMPSSHSALVVACTTAAARLEGAFSLVILDGGGRLVALRDPSGYRPLCVGESEAGIAVASESCALEIGGFSSIRDVRPGEILVMENGRLIARDAVPASRPAAGGLCIFEYVYFARPDSVIDGLSVYEARCRMGRILAREHPADADIVCGVPDSGLEAAAGYSAESGLPLATGFMKNRYVGRSFIFPTQTQRDTAVRLKLNPLPSVIRGKRLCIRRAATWVASWPARRRWSSTTPSCAATRRRSSSTCFGRPVRRKSISAS